MYAGIVRFHVLVQVVQTRYRAGPAVGRGQFPAPEADFRLVDEDDGSGVRVRIAACPMVMMVLLADFRAVGRFSVPASMVIAVVVARLEICAGG